MKQQNRNPKNDLNVKHHNPENQKLHHPKRKTPQRQSQQPRKHPHNNLPKSINTKVYLLTQINR